MDVNKYKFKQDSECESDLSNSEMDRRRIWGATWIQISTYPGEYDESRTPAYFSVSLGPTLIQRDLSLRGRSGPQSLICGLLWDAGSPNCSPYCTLPRDLISQSFRAGYNVVWWAKEYQHLVSRLPPGIPLSIQRRCPRTPTASWPFFQHYVFCGQRPTRRFQRLFQGRPIEVDCPRNTRHICLGRSCDSYRWSHR